MSGQQPHAAAAGQAGAPGQAETPGERLYERYQAAMHGLGLGDAVDATWDELCDEQQAWEALAARPAQDAPGKLYVTPGDGTPIGGLLAHVGMEAQAAPGDEALSESQRFQVSEARDILATWDLNSPGGISRETVLADQVRALLAIIDQRPQAAQAAPGAHPPSPEPDGTVVIGPGCFASAEGDVISWRGRNYYPFYRQPAGDVKAAPELAAAGMVPLDAAVLHLEVHKLSGQIEAVRTVCEGASAGMLANTPRGRLATAVLAQLDGHATETVITDGRSA